ncbi:Soluble starch synthase [Vigna angularis]|uniref:starch synthase n=1 Tax=Phaseolus angularis TaxID=3914 RepID=A0A8T0L604_PHAAN|nr:Soluble starch synthase [Vigna angularis]
MPKGHGNGSKKHIVLVPSIGTSNLVGKNEKAYIFNKKDIVEASKGDVKYLDEKLVGYPKIITIIEEPDVNGGGNHKANREVVIGKIDYHVSDILNEEATQELKSQLEERFERQEIERIAKENVSLQNKLFVYPPVAMYGQDIEVFLNRSLSTLCTESDIFIKGGFNDWRWKPFTERLNKTDILSGDWWSCRLHVPKEAYGMDFVLFNGKSVYDNNDEKDFFIPVNGGMDALGFEDFLLEEKRKELEKLAKEQAEKEEIEEIRRKMEAEKAAREEDRSIAIAEVEKMKNLLQNLTKNAVKSVKNLWYIEPIEFEGKDLVRLFYNRKSGPLANVPEVWLHGGYNGWKEKLSFVKRLVKIGTKNGDWWCADEKAIVLDWVFANAPPRNASAYDNNNNKDFRALVSKVIPDEETWILEQERIYIKLQEQRRLKEEALAAKGKPEVWFTHSFNRWTHRNGLFPPQKMLPSKNQTYLKTSVKVPLDAYTIDFVFSDKKDGGIFDNNNTMDYRIPVSGSIVKETTLNIVHIALEMAPIAKVGGLGDVVTSLSRAIQELDHRVDIILPKYDCLNLSNVKDFRYHRNYFWNGSEIKVWHGKVEGLSVYFLEPQNQFFRVGRIYGCENDAERFGFFCHAALEYLFQAGFHPDIIHCHDWSSAPVTWLCKEQYRQCSLSKAGVVFTVHNIECGAHLIGKAMAYTDKATTVSPTYSREVYENPIFRPHFDKFHGILNGIDPDIWDPLNDKFIPISYTSENVVQGKKAAKEALQQRLGLRTVDRPLLGIISRLTHQKGIYLIKHAIYRTLERGGQIYAGADFIAVPSIFEPCGLTQLIAMRYGSIPVVRKTGGLYDTVFDVDHDKDRARAQDVEPNGFNFDGTDAAGVDYALNRAISRWYEERHWFNSLCKTVMEQDWSWNRPALDYLELYHAARKAP